MELGETDQAERAIRRSSAVRSASLDELEDATHPRLWYREEAGQIFKEKEAATLGRLFHSVCVCGAA